MGLNKIVSFELAKFLKEKGFDKPVRYNYDLTGELHNVGLQNHNEHPLKISAPTIDEVKWWFYEKYEIWITVWSAYNNNYKFSYGILYRKNIVVFHETNFDEKESPTEAYEAAIEYTLKNLI